MSKSIEQQQFVLNMIPLHPKDITMDDMFYRLRAKGLINLESKPDSQRTAARRIVRKAIENFGTIEEFGTRKNRSYRVAQGATHPLYNNQLSTIVPLKISEEQVIKTLPPTLKNDFQDCMNASDSSPNPIIQLWKKRFYYADSNIQLQPTACEDQHFNTIESALMNKKNLKMEYKKPGEPLESYEITPLGLVLREGSYYLIAKKSKDKYRIFNIVRIKEIKEWFSTPPSMLESDFDTERFLINNPNFLGGGNKVKITLQIDNKLGYSIINEKPINKSQKILSKSETQTVVDLEIRDNKALIYWLVQYGNFIEVLEPELIREKVVRHLKKTLSRYEDNKL